MAERKSNRPFLSVEEVAEHLGVNYQLIYRLVRSGKLPAVRLGRVYRIRSDDLDAYLARNATAKDEGFTCCACGNFFHSTLSQGGSSEKTGQPICFDCWSRKGVRSCPESSSQSNSTQT